MNKSCIGFEDSEEKKSGGVNGYAELSSAQLGRTAYLLAAQPASGIEMARKQKKTTGETANEEVREAPASTCSQDFMRRNAF